MSLTMMVISTWVTLEVVKMVILMRAVVIVSLSVSFLLHDVSGINTALSDDTNEKRPADKSGASFATDS